MTTVISDIELEPSIETPSHQRFKRIFDICGFFMILTIIVVVFINWKDLTPCFKRQAIVVIIALFYWLLRGDTLGSFFAEILQVFVLFVLVQKINTDDVDKVSGCLDVTSPFRKTIYLMYITLFSYYLSVCMIFCFILVIFLLSEFSNSRFVSPYINRRRAIRGREFEALEKVKFTRSEGIAANAQTMCSICLSDFQEQEEIIKLPICNHFFHKECVKKWLEMHRKCPYCRSDIKTNLRLLRRQTNNSNIQSSGAGQDSNLNLARDYSLEMSTHLQQVENREELGNRSNLSQIYAEMPEL